MDVFYEESALARNTGKQSKKWKVLNVLSYVFLCLAIVLAYNTIMCIPTVPAGSEGFDMAFSLFIIFLFNTMFMFSLWVLFFFWKRRTNVSYDYSFVSGELRIVKVYQNKRKVVTKLECKNILQLGDADSDSYERLAKDPAVQKVVCTSNAVADTGKFYMYILANDGGKKMYILECREVLLMHIMRFVSRSVLASDYVPQDKRK